MLQFTIVGNCNVCLNNRCQTDATKNHITPVWHGYKSKSLHADHILSVRRAVVP